MEIEILNNPYFSVGGAILLSCVIAYLSIPVIAQVAKDKKLFDIPNGRSSHTEVIPSLGGIAIFSAFMISYLIFRGRVRMTADSDILAGMVIIFFLGLKDDIQALDAKKKLLGQIVAALLVVVLGDIRFTSFYGFMSITEVPYWVSVLFTLFIIVVVTNAINLVDGIDGLASGTAVVALSSFGLWYLLAGFLEEALFSFSVVGALLAFFYYNVYGKKSKLFMGDTGSLLLGFLMAVVAVRFSEVNIGLDNPYAVKSAPGVAIGVLILPLFDTLRVFVTRIMSGHSPFSPDKRHLHHRLLSLSSSHKAATYKILVVNISFVILSFLIGDLGLHYVLLILIVLAAFMSFVPVVMMKKRDIEID